MNLKHKLGQYIKGTENSVKSRSQMKTQPKQGTIGAIIHNHPNNTSLSVEDLMGTKPDGRVQIRPNVFADVPKQQIVNTTPNGSTYRAYLKRETTNSKPFKRNYNKVFDSVDNEFRQLKPGKLSAKDLERRTFLVSHLANRSLANNGTIHYRAKLTPKDRRTLDFWLQRSPKLKSIYDGEN